MNCQLKSAFSRGSKVQKLCLIFLVASYAGTCSGTDRLSGRDTLLNVEFGEAVEFWELIHYQLFIKGLSGVVLRSALR